MIQRAEIGRGDRILKTWDGLLLRDRAAWLRRLAARAHTFRLVRPRWVIAAATSLVVAGGAACSSSSEPNEPHAAPSVTALADAPRPAEGAPPACTELVADADLLSLVDQIRSGHPDVGSAPKTLRAVADEFDSATEAANALERWANSPADDKALEELAAAFGALAKEVQPECGFPLA